MEIVKILYLDWWIPLILIYIVVAVAYLCFKNMLISKNEKLPGFGFITSLIVPICAIFYFLIPVPESIQTNLIKKIYLIKEYNDDPNFSYLNIKINQYCDSKNINSFEFYQLKESYLKDVDVIFEDKKYMNLGKIGKKIDFKEKNICELKNRI